MKASPTPVSPPKSPFASLPSVDQLLRDQRAQSLIASYGKDSVKQAFVKELNKIRSSITAIEHRAVNKSVATKKSNKKSTSKSTWKDTANRQPELSPAMPDLTIDKLAQTKSQVIDSIIRDSESTLLARFSPSIRPVINLTGIILHTNLGRAPYPQSAIDAMVRVSSGAANVEFNLETGERGKRDDHVAHWLCELTGAEAATTVNNNAAAVLLVLNTLAEKRQVVVSRGELIEIGGSFRMPDIMEKARCKLVEVGTTNRTHSYDYSRAINKKTAALMKVHTSNFEIAGFGHSVSVAELASLAKKAKLTVIDDMGSGNLLDLQSYGLPPERTARQAIAEGADIITFSGDKLLGGPQCGLIAGKRKLIDKINKNPLKRAMRLDKVTLAALEAVLKLYAQPETLTENLPVLATLIRSPDEIEQSANTLAESLRRKLPASVEILLRPCESQIGSGSLPTKTIPSRAVVLRCKDPLTNIQGVASQLRQLPTPVVGRVYKNALWLDCRALTEQKTISESISHWPDQ